MLPSINQKEKNQKYLNSPVYSSQRFKNGSKANLNTTNFESENTLLRQDQSTIQSQIYLNQTDQELNDDTIQLQQDESFLKQYPGGNSKRSELNVLHQYTPQTQRLDLTNNTTLNHQQQQQLQISKSQISLPSIIDENNRVQGSNKGYLNFGESNQITDIRKKRDTMTNIIMENSRENPMQHSRLSKSSRFGNNIQHRSSINLNRSFQNQDKLFTNKLATQENSEIYPINENNMNISKRDMSLSYISEHMTAQKKQRVIQDQKKRMKEQTKRHLEKLKEKIKQKFEIETNPLRGNNINLTKFIIDEVNKQYSKKDSSGQQVISIDEDSLSQSVVYLDKFSKQIQLLGQKIKSSEVNDKFNELMVLQKQCGIPVLQIYTSLLKAKFNLRIGNCYQALREVFQCKTFARLHKYPLIKIKCYKLIGKAYMEINDYGRAKNAYLKLLVMAWYLDNQYLELIAYDNLGLIFFYEGDLNTSRVLHQKSVQGKSEDSKTSKTRQKKLELFNLLLQQTEDERNLRKLKQQNVKQQSDYKEEDDRFDANYDSSEDEDDAFVREMVSYELLNQNKEEDPFEKEKERSIKYKMMKKKNKGPRIEYYDQRKQPYITKRLSHQSYNRSSQLYKSMSKHDMIQYKNFEDKMFLFLISPKVVEYLKVSLGKLRKRIYLAANEIEKVRKQEHDNELMMLNTQSNASVKNTKKRKGNVLIKLF